MLPKLFLLAVLFFACAGAPAQTPPPARSAAESQRVARLAGLGKVWGTVKYFHPFLAYREIDWDKNLIAAIPAVNAAKTPQEYAAAINSLLAALGDETTRAQVVAEKPKNIEQNAAPSAQPTKEAVRLENGVLVIEGAAAGKAIAATNNLRFELPAKVTQLLPQAKTVLIDLRRDEAGAAAEDGTNYYLDTFLRETLPQLLDKNVTLPAARYRLHSGYAPQVGSTSGGYYSALVTDAPETLAGQNKNKTPPLVFLVNEDSPATDIAGGLQAAKMAFVVQDGAATGSEAGGAAHIIKLAENVEVKMRTTEFVNADSTVGFAADLIAPKGEALQTAQRIIAENKFVSNRQPTASRFASQISQKDQIYSEMEFPSREYRLLALFRFWNAIHYFFPYKNLIDKPWDNVLTGYISKFEASRDAAEYELAVREMVAEIQDSHGGVRFPKISKSAERLGRFLPPMIVGWIENQSVVTKILDPNAGVREGDVILTVDNEPAEKYREKAAIYHAASTPQSLQQRVHWNFLRGQQDARAKLTVRGLDGKIRAVEIVRNISAADPRWTQAFAAGRKTPVVSVLPSGFGYVDLARLTGAEVDKMFETIKNTTGAIFDMRGYPNGTAWAIAPRLTEKKSPVAARFSRPIVSGPSLDYLDYSDGTNFTFGQRLPEPQGEVYKGKVVMLIDENAISQSEHTALFFETARPDIAFIGMPTTGANGDVTNLVLPGNIIVSFSGHDVRHADGRQLQRVGIQPTVRVEPTIRGTIEGRDEILAAAVNYLQQNTKK